MDAIGKILNTYSLQNGLKVQVDNEFLEVYNKVMEGHIILKNTNMDEKVRKRDSHYSPPPLSTPMTVI